MAKSDQVISAAPIARMVKKIDALQFQVLNQNGFFATIAGEIVLEFDKLSEAQKVVGDLNAACASVLSTFKSDYEKKIGDLLA